MSHFKLGIVASQQDYLIGKEAKICSLNLENLEVRKKCFLSSTDKGPL